MNFNCQMAKPIVNAERLYVAEANYVVLQTGNRLAASPVIFRFWQVNVAVPDGNLLME